MRSAFVSQIRTAEGPCCPRLSPGLALVALTLAMSAAQAFDSGSTGADGVLNPTASVEIVLPPSGVLNYSSINIPSGVTVTFRRNALNTPVQLLVSGNATIAGTIDVRGRDATDVGTAGGGNLSDDGTPGVAGPGGFDGGVGGKAITHPDSSRWAGSAGLGPGGGWGGVYTAIRGTGSCFQTRINYYAVDGLGAGYAELGANPHAPYGCGFTGRGQTYGSSAIQPMIGGSGGGGGSGTESFPGAGGGGGGGALLIAVTGTLTVSGTINADGGNGGGIQGGGSTPPAAGGGGAGGAIRLVATTVAGGGSLLARAGCNRTQGCSAAAAASVGRIRIEGDTVTFTGTNTPTASRDVPGPVSLPAAPGIRIATIAGQAVPANPTGVRDVTLPTPLANPVTVEFATANVPPGNTIKLRVVPANGDPVEALSPAITGTTASGAASVSINLPNGASTLQAIASFTIAVGMGESLSRFAHNERVDRVELVAGLGGEAQAYLVTVSGKRHRVPAALLQMLGPLS